MQGGVAGGLAFYPAVPGLAPGAFMGPEAERASGPEAVRAPGAEAERLAGGDEIAGRGPHKSPRREPGDCDVVHRSVGLHLVVS